MCGICGEWRYDGGPVDEDWLTRACERLRVRGPDDGATHIEPGVGLGHRRLSIIDLSPAGRMPMTNETADIWAVFNGEIYNFRALREQLEAAGHRFRSHTDSEVVIHGYEEWGLDCFRRFDGMFAIALWDRRAQQLILARDITGEKPLYYTLQRDVLRFASTLAALQDRRHALDPHSVRAYIELGYVPAPRALWSGVHKVEPGTYLVVSRDGTPRVQRYWNLADAATAPHRDVDMERATDELHELLRTTVRSRMVADVPLGAFLSGGIDSTTVVALMAEASRDKVSTFTIGFDDPAWDESKHAQAIASHLGVTNTRLVLSGADVLRELDQIPRAFDEPLADASVMPSLAVARLARQHVTVALSGDGADEAFGGYRYYGGTRAFQWLSRIVPASLRQRLAQQGRRIPDARIARAVQRGAVPDAAAYFARSGFHRGGTADRSSALVLGAHAGEAIREIEREIRASPLGAAEAGMLWDATHTLPNAWLTKVDRATMACSLEARAPFLARPVLEYAFSLPWSLRVHRTRKKVLLRRILSRYLPAELYERPKQGFAPPLRRWFARELHDELHDRITSARIARYGVLDTAGVMTLLAEHERGAHDHTQMLWALFCLDRWYDAYVAP